MSFEYHTHFEQLKKHRSIARLSALETLLARFSTGERVVLYGLSIILAASTFALLACVSNALSIAIPTQGGSLTEGLVGPARFINPVIALSQSDNDLATLVYSGLTRTLPDGSIIPDLASTYDISHDGTVYTFHLRPNASFHDGTPVLAADVLFTIQKAKDPDIKSPHRADWEGVTVSAPDSHTIVCTLAHPYAPFLENTSLGILPKHLWEHVSAQDFPFSPLNIHAIGTGPYRVSRIDIDETGVPTRFDLVPFSAFTLGKPYVSTVTFLFYPNNDDLLTAYNAGDIDSVAGIAPADVSTIHRKDAALVHAALPRTFGIFFNQSKNPLLADASVRTALDSAIHKDVLVADVLKGYGVVLTGPIPPHILDHVDPATPHALTQNIFATSTVDTSANAKNALIKGGWVFDPHASVWKKHNDILHLSLATADEPELSATAQSVAASWRSIGIVVDVHVYPLSELNTIVIRPRAYDAILFGEVVGRTVDLFAFWHSSQRSDPGLNVSMYANSKTDSLLTQARATDNKKDRARLYTQFASIINADKPAVFLYAPDFIYLVPRKLSGVDIGVLTTPSERFATIYTWYIETERVWTIFTK